MKWRCNIIFYEGKSVLDGAPIVGILTGYNKKGSANGKTGRMLQTWILRSDIHPAVAAQNGSDYSICGDCKHRADAQTSRKRTCYVNVAYAPSAVYRAYKAGAYRTVEEWSLPDDTRSDSIRMGAYGDPASIPQSRWALLGISSRHHTGYTHQWKLQDAQWLQPYCMASCDSVAEYVEAKSMGWNAFVVHNHQDHKTRELLQLHGVKPCPSSKEWIESGKKHVSCEKCLACDGTKGSRLIAGHGSAKNRIGLKVLV